MENNNTRRPSPRFRQHQWVRATDDAGQEVLCQIQRRDWNVQKNHWSYFCLAEGGQHLYVPEKDIRAIGPKPVEEKLLNVVQQQEYALGDAILASLDEAMEEFDANNVSVKVGECTYDGIFKDENGQLCTMQEFGGTRSPMVLGNTNSIILISLFYQYVLKSTEQPGMRPL